MEIIQDKKNEILRRREIKAIVNAPKNPSMQEAVKMIAEYFKADLEKVVVKSIQGKFGRKSFLIVASIYDNKDDKDKTEIKSKKQRDAEKKAIGESKKQSETLKAEGEKKEEG